MVTKKSWDEFRESGLLWWINMILHTFGWAITVDVDKEGKVTGAAPARVKYRGFDEKHNEEGYVKTTNFLKEHVDELVEDCKE